MIKLITHNDLDGIGCYIVAKYFLGDKIDVSYCSYKNVNEVVLETIENIEKYNKVFITDISVNEEVAKELDKVRNKIRLFDHHPTALFLNEYVWCNVVEVDNDGDKTCGTKLFYDYLNDDSLHTVLERFVHLVRLYDTWLWKDKYNEDTPKKLNDLMYIVGKETFIENMVRKTRYNEPIFNDTDKIILELRQNEIDRYVEEKNKNIIVKDILGYKVGVVFADNFISELGNKLSEMHPELDFIAMVNQETVSYRTVKDDVNLSEVAATFGGGGHPKASGSQVEESKTSRFIDDLFNI